MAELKIIGENKNVALIQRELNLADIVEENTVLVEPFVIHGLKWKVMLNRKHRTSSCGTKVETASLHVQCNSDVTTRWGCVYAEAEMCFLPFEKDLPPVMMRAEDIFSLEDNSCLSEDACNWSQLVDPNFGFCKDNKIIVKVALKSDYPRPPRQP